MQSFCLVLVLDQALERLCLSVLKIEHDLNEPKITTLFMLETVSMLYHSKIVATRVLVEVYFFRFMPSTCVLTITIRFTVLKKAAHVRRALRERHVTTVHSDDEMSSVSTDNEIEDNDVNSIATDEGNVWPLHYDTEINSSRISCIDIANRRVTTENGGIYSFEEAINYFSLLIS